MSFPVALNKNHQSLLENIKAGTEKTCTVIRFIFHLGSCYHLNIVPLFLSHPVTRPRQHAGIIPRWPSFTSLWVRPHFLKDFFLAWST